MSDSSQSVYQTGETTLLNVKNADEEDWSVYVGRKNNYYNLPQSEFANPFRLDDYSRDASVDLYTLWFMYQIVTDDAFKSSAENLQGETLACWCVPERCHGMVLVDYAENQTVPIQELHEIVERRDTGSLDGVDERTKETITAAVNWLESE